MASRDICFICDKSLLKGDICEVKEKGLNTLRSFSVKRRDGKDTLLKGVKCISVHQACRKVYTKDRSAEALLKSSQKLAEASCSKRNIVGFDFKKKCIFCAEDAAEEFLKKESKKLVGKRDIVQRVETMTMKDTVVAYAEKRKDDWGKQVVLRIDVFDLVAVEARYHRSCMKSFYKTQSGLKRGRPEETQTTDAMTHAYNFLESNREECQFSLDDLFEGYQGDLPTTRTIKTKLLEKYGEDITITTLPNQKPIICFRDTGKQILTKAWYSEQKKRRKRGTAKNSTIRCRNHH